MAGIAGLLALRGELLAFLTAQADNVRYANGPIIDSPYGGFLGHLLKVVTEDGRGGVLATVALTAAVALCSRGATPTVVALQRATWTTLAAETVVLGLTGFWPHHAQVFATSAVLALVLAAGEAQRLLTPTPASTSTSTSDTASPLGPGRVVVAGLLAAYVLGGAVHPYWYVEAVRAVPDAVRAERDPSPEARALLALSPTGSYARLGSNDVTAHARGLEGWDLACPRFQLYSFDPPATLTEAADCAVRTDTVIVDASFAPAAPDAPQRAVWDVFVSTTRSRLAETHTCTAEPWGQLCLRHNP